MGIIYQHEEYGKLRTKAKFSGQWMGVPFNPGRYARQYGMNYLKLGFETDQAISIIDNR